MVSSLSFLARLMPDGLDAREREPATMGARSELVRVAPPAGGYELSADQPARSAKSFHPAACLTRCI